MAWSKSSTEINGKKAFIAEETVPLGKTVATRYSSVIDFIPPNTDFTIITNADATNTSGSLHDELWISTTSTGTKYELREKLRDEYYSNQGTSFDTLDTKRRVRFHDVSHYGQGPYYWIGLDHAAAESTGKTIKCIILHAGQMHD